MTHLREMVQGDLQSVLAWRNNESVRKNMYTSHIISADEHQRWWEQHSVNARSVLLIAEKNEVPVGVVIFTNYTGPGGTASWAFYAAQGAPKGVGREMERAALDYAFDTLSLRKLECEVLSFNMPVVNLHRRHGFEIEGIFRQAYARDGEMFDIYRLAIFPETWLKHMRPQVENGAFVSLVGRSHSESIKLTDEMVGAFMDATGDRNPVHMQAEYARRCGFNDRLVHGMLCGSFFSHIFATHLPGPGTIYLEQDLKFVRPVYAGSEVIIKVTVASHIGRRIAADCEISVDGEACVIGSAKLLAPKN